MQLWYVGAEGVFLSTYHDLKRRIAALPHPSVHEQEGRAEYECAVRSPKPTFPAPRLAAILPVFK